MPQIVLRRFIKVNDKTIMLTTRLITKSLNGPLMKVPCRNSAYTLTKERKRGLNDLPKPKCGWQQNYAAMQRKHNIQLAIGGFVFVTGLFSISYSIDFHFYPPPNPNC